MILLVVAFAVILLLGVPVAFALGLAALLFLLVTQAASPMVIATLMFSGIDSFPLMAIPFFILTGFLAERSGVLGNLVEFASSIVGHLRGGLAHVNIVSSMLLSGVTGTAVGDAAAIGSMLIPGMIKEGYDRRFAAVLTASASVMGPIIPPSVGMVIYAFVSGGTVSVAGLFLAGVTPGVFIGLSLMALVLVLAIRRDYPLRREPFRILTVLRNAWRAMLGLMVPVIILGGILFGIFTPTEAGAVAVAYVLIAGTLVTRQLRPRDIASCLLETAKASTVVFMLLATARVMAWLLVIHQIPQKVGAALMAATDNRYTFLLLTLFFLFLLGFVLEAIATMIMLVPVLGPIAQMYGIDPLQFGLLFVMTIQIALITPPVALSLFITCNIARCALDEVFGEIWPFIGAIFAVILLVVVWPDFALWLPKVFGLAR